MLSKYKKVDVLPIRIVQSNVANVGPSSERNRKYIISRVSSQLRLIIVRSTPFISFDACMQKRVDVVKPWNQARVWFLNFEIHYLGNEQQTNRPGYIYSRIVISYFALKSLKIHLYAARFIAFYGFSFCRFLAYFFKSACSNIHKC